MMPQAEAIVNAILRDLNRRTGLRQEWEQITEDIQEEIKSTWIKLVEKINADHVE